MKFPVALIKDLDEDQMKQLGAEIRGSLLAKCLRKFLREEIERSYRAEEQLDQSHDALPFYLKEVGERRGYRQVLHMILEE
jgi:predicted methyltransferase MtxX (methanogen marker protein 4)